jgi:broad specificity phosphatase PhoE
MDNSSAEAGCRDLLLIRHGTTDMAGTLCGQSDPPLNEQGMKQAEALALRLQGTPVYRLYSSDLQRAVQTAVTLSAVWNVDVIPRKDLREISFGDWEGRRWAEIRQSLPGTQAMDSTPDFGAPNGETFAAFRHRVLTAFREIIADSRQVCTAVVAHLGVIRIVLSELSSPDALWTPDQKMEYCAVYRIRLGSGFSELQLPQRAVPACTFKQGRKEGT